METHVLPWCAGCESKEGGWEGTAPRRVPTRSGFTQLCTKLHFKGGLTRAGNERAPDEESRTRVHCVLFPGPGPNPRPPQSPAANKARNPGLRSRQASLEPILLTNRCGGQLLTSTPRGRING